MAGTPIGRKKRGEDGARWIQGTSATFPKQEIVAYAEKLYSSGVAGTSPD
jgi:hypothetical protein